MERSDPAEYFLQVVKDRDMPQWPRPEEELVVGSQPLDGGYTQYWAYLKESSKEADELPHAEVIASENKAEKQAILIDQYGPSGEMELVLVKDGHAWGKEQSSLDNLEDNISSLLDFAMEQFNMEIEHFMTTARVPKEVEDKLDDLEAAGDVSGKSHYKALEKEGSLVSDEDNKVVEAEKPEDPDTQNALGTEEDGMEDVITPHEKIRFSRPAMSSDRQIGGSMGVGSSGGQTLYKGGATGVGSFSGQGSSSGSSKAWLIPVVLVLALFGGALFFKDTITGSLKGSPAPTPTPVTAVPTATPTPTPALDRSQYKVRVLNGTTKSGAAGALADSLEAKGWEILSKGNAKDQATAQTTVRVKEGSEAVAETLISDLSPDLEASTGANLTASDKADAEVVIGKK